jgi:hypothetical protein
MKTILRFVVTLGGLAALVGPVIDLSAQAGVAGKALRETAELVLRQPAKSAATEGSEALAQSGRRLVTRFGDDAGEAIRKTGLAGIKAMEAAGEHGVRVARLLARHGDDAAQALARHGQIALPLIEQFGTSAARALKSLSSRNARRLGIMTDAGELRRIGRVDEVLAVIGRHGDRAMTFVWQHKGALAITAVLAAFLAQPEPFVNGARDLADIVGEDVARPLAEVPGKVAAEVASGTNWTVVITFTLLVCAVLLSLTTLRVRRHRSRRRERVDGPLVKGQIVAKSPAAELKHHAV